MRDPGSLRLIVVDGESYLWKFMPCCEGNGPHRSVFVAYKQGCKQAPLRIIFRSDDDNWVLVHEGTPPPPHHGQSLHTPGVAARLIREARQLGWSAETGGRFEVQDGVGLLRHVQGW